ncbi:MAG: ATP-binding protein, partial [Prevotellaceae bacterium]|nr:ATP-binding protein [Prevotellaceae bacterium]
VIKFALPAFSLHIMMQAMLYNLMPVYQFYGHKNIAFFLSIGQTLLPMICYWVMKGNWFGFFVGQMVTAIVLLIATICVRRKNPQLYPILLIPKDSANAVFDVSMPLTKTKTLNHQLAELRNKLTEFLRNNGASEKVVNHGVLCAEELLKNIIQHGHAHYADIKATKDYISIHDDGRPFNPIEYSDATGYGILIVKGLCKDVQYKYLFNQNMTICKLWS